MAITNYSELLAALPDWMDRTDLNEAKCQECVALAEARLNRVLKEVETQTALNGVSGVRTIDISALQIIAPISLKVEDSPTVWFGEREIILKPLGVIDYNDTAAQPRFYELNGSNIAFDSPMDQNYSFRFIYRGRFALSESAPTNALLTNEPDVYLAAAIVWGGLYVEDDPKVSKWKSLLDEAMAETKHALAQKKRSVLTPDPMFTATQSGRAYPYYWWPVS